MMTSYLRQNVNKCLTLACFAALLGSQAALAQTNPPARSDVEAVLTAKKVQLNAEKKEVLVDAKEARPGDVIEYQVTYANKGKTNVTGLIGTLPVPDGTEFVRNSVRPSAARATTGDGRFAAIPLKRKVKLPNGKEEEQDVPLAEYKSLQWSLGELAAGKSVVVVARVRVSDAPTPPPPTPASSAPPQAKGGTK
jgi:uncharacterized repeat protein (TIGR01451 family)